MLTFNRREFLSIPLFGPQIAKPFGFYLLHNFPSFPQGNVTPICGIDQLQFRTRTDSIEVAGRKCCFPSDATDRGKWEQALVRVTRVTGACSFASQQQSSRSRPEKAWHTVGKMMKPKLTVNHVKKQYMLDARSKGHGRILNRT